MTPATDEDGPLWSSIKGQLYRSEVAHVKILVGESLIQKNKLMWDELASLKQMLSDFQEQNDELTEGVKQQVKFCGSQHRDLLRRQCQMVLADITQQAESCGHNLEDLLPDTKDRELCDYIRGGKELRRGPSGKLEGFTPPATPSTRPPSSSGMRPLSSGGRSGCSTPDIAGCPPLPLGRALNLEDLSLVAKGIREALEAEHESLLTAIGEQMEHLEVEADHRANTVGRMSRGEPSTAELQQFVHKLQELQASPSLRTLALTGPESGLAAAPGGSSVRRLQALIAQRRLASPREKCKAPGGLGAVPEVQPLSPGGGLAVKPLAGGGYPAPSGVAFDPFFDDPLFAAAVGAGSPIQESSILS